MDALRIKIQVETLKHQKTKYIHILNLYLKMKFTVHSVRTRRWSRGLIMHSCRRAKKDCLLSTFVSQMSKSLHVKNLKEKASNLKSLKIGQRPTLRAL